MPRNYNNGEYRSVTIRGYPNLNYGFLSRIESSNYAELGQAIINSSTTNLVVGCNAPKPGTAKKLLVTGGSKSSFFSSGEGDKTAALKKANWKVTAGTRRFPSRSKVSAPYYVTIGGVKYAWQTTLLPGGALPTSYGAASGAKPVEDDDLVVWGCSYPKPPRITTELEGQGTFSSFADPSALNSLPNGWEISSGAISGAAHATKYYS